MDDPPLSLGGSQSSVTESARTFVTRSLPAGGPGGTGVGRKEMFYLMTHSTHFIYSYMVVDFIFIFYFLFNDALNTFYLLFFCCCFLFFLFFLFNDTLNTFYLLLYGCCCVCFVFLFCFFLFNDALNTFHLLLYGRKEGRKEGNILFINALNPFYLRLYGCCFFLLFFFI